MGEYYERKNPPGKKRGPKPEYFTEERRKEMAERGKRGALSPSRELTLEKQRISKKKKFIKAYKKHRGMKTAACEACKMGYTTYQQWRKEDPEFDRQLTEIDEMVLDQVETKLLELIDGPTEQKLDVKGNVHDLKLAPNVKAVQYYLDTKGKNRGYGKTLNIPDGGIQIVLTPAQPKQVDNANTIHIEGREEE
jgi:hypothetical protein